MIWTFGLVILTTILLVTKKVKIMNLLKLLFVLGLVVIAMVIIIFVGCAQDPGSCGF